MARKDDAKRFDQTNVHQRNQQLARIRTRVEHVFGSWEKTMGKTIRTIGGVRAAAQITVQATVYDLRRWVTLMAKGRVRDEKKGVSAQKMGRLHDQILISGVSNKKVSPLSLPAGE